MENKFDALAKALADSVSRREALSRLGGGLAGLLLTALGGERAWGAADNGCGFEIHCWFFGSLLIPVPAPARCNEHNEQQPPLPSG